jgi:transcription-repair coupling factor (superfamily II helicase)
VDLIGLLSGDARVERIIDRLRSGRALVRGAVGSSTTMLAGALAVRTQAPVLLVVAHADDAEEAREELSDAGVEAVVFPALETLPGETEAVVELYGQRLNTVRRVMGWHAPGPAPRPRVLVAPIQALMQSVPAPSAIEQGLLEVLVGQALPPRDLAAWLDRAGYARVDVVSEPGEYAVRGGIVDIFPPGDPASDEGEPESAPGGLPLSTGGVPVRLDYFGDVIDRMSEVDPDTMGSDRAIRGARLIRASLQGLGHGGQATLTKDGATERGSRARGRGGASSQAGSLEDTSEPTHNLVELLPPGTVGVLWEVIEITEQGRGYFERAVDSRGLVGPPRVFALIQKHCTGGRVEVTAIGQYAAGEDEVVDLPVSPVPPLEDDVPAAVAELARLGEGASGPRLEVVVYCQSDAEATRLAELLAEHAPGTGSIRTARRYLHTGFLWERTLALPYAELLHRFQVRRRARTGRLRAGRAIDTFLDLQVGDYVVHAEHGIARFVGLKLMRPRESRATVDERLRGGASKVDTGEQPGEYLILEFDGRATLYVPAVKADQVQKYVGGARGTPALSTLGGAKWKRQKERVAESVRDLAAEMLRVRAAREASPGIRFPPDTPWQREFEDEFPYEETEDQVAALGEIKRDMTSPRPMDRLLCGDVGYGKTELAVRAAFKAAEHGKQVAVLVPTTVLAEQHERTFRARFAAYPFRVESLSRFKTTAEVRRVLEGVAAGSVDVVIGTHRLLSADVRFKDLGVVIIDEEQRFGVEHKERLLSLRMTVDVLTLSATPIPRTLHMSMLGLRDISSLATPPQDRRAVVTEVLPHNPARIKQALDRELAREGQVFYVHNRIHDILSVADDLQRLVPDARIVVGHGQMADHDLEQVMLRFMRREADILVSTTIIESGIDIPTANTIIIDHADRFGLSELHQLRGRVGRGRHRGYCYLLVDPRRPLRETAGKRLRAIEQFSMLGAGFKIAMRDLEIRGAGNILGPEQSGHIAAVGYDMYCQLLERAVKELRHEVTAAPSEVSVEIGVTGLIPRAYIPSDTRRLEAYRRLAVAASAEDLARVEADLAAAYGPIPESVGRLFRLAEVRVGARLMGIRSITVREKDVVIRTTDPGAVVQRLTGAQGTVVALPVRSPTEVPEVYYRPPPAWLEPDSLLAVLLARLGVRQPAAESVPSPTPETRGDRGGGVSPGGKGGAGQRLRTLRRMMRESRRGRGPDDGPPGARPGLKV